MTTCFGCKNLFSMAKEMKVANFIANMIAFSPPGKVNYQIEEINHTTGNTTCRGACYKQVKFIHNEYSSISYPWIDIECYQIQKTSNKKRIVLLRVINNNIQKDKKFTFIFSHGNSCDLSTIYPLLIDLSTALKADVISYDYSGYGHSEGSPSESELNTDIEQLMDFVTVYLRTPLENIILIGNSLGSVPSVHIAHKINFSKIKGLILISPIASGMKLYKPEISMTTADYEKADVFCNLSKVHNITCPVLLIHGMQDDVIPQTQSEELLNRIKHVFEWFPRRGSHSNILTKYRTKFYAKVKLFLEHVEYSKNNVGSCNFDNYENGIVTKNSAGNLLEKHNENSKKINSISKTTNIILKKNYIKCEENFNRESTSLMSSPIKSKIINNNF
jgi:pimeloyl-ACP methyl ester carboxylesterase